MSLPVPLTVRLSNSKTDRHITRDLRSLRFDSAVPGGFTSAVFELDRPLSIDHDDIQPFTKVYIYDGRSAEVAWQGRLGDPGRGAGPDGQVWTLIADGPAVHARDRTEPLVYVDTSTEQWVAARPGKGDIGLHIEEESADNPALKVILPRNFVVDTNDKGSWSYTAVRDASMELGRIQTKHIWGTSSAGATANRAQIFLQGGGSTIAADQGASTSEQTMTAVATTDFTVGRDHLILRYQRDGANATVSNDDFYVLFYSWVVRSILYDKTGAKRTAGSAYTANTVTADEIVADLLGRLLNKYDGTNASIATNSFAIDQLAYFDGATPAEVLDDLMRLHTDHYWAAWEGDTARFEWFVWPTTVRYEASALDGFDSPSSAAEIYNRVNVRWLDRKGRRRNNTRTQTVTVLDDAGLTRAAWLDLGDTVGSSAMADRVGDQFLAEHANALNQGTLTIRRAIPDLTSGRSVDPWLIKPGNLIRVRDVVPRADALNATTRDAVTIFKVVGVSYDAATNTATLELDQRSRNLENMLARREVRRRR